MKGQKRNKSMNKKKINYPKKINKRNYNEVNKGWKYIDQKVPNNSKLKLNSDNAYLTNQKIYLDKNSILNTIFNLKEIYLEIEDNITYSINIPNNHEFNKYI